MANILIIDDDDVVLSTIGEVVAALGHRARTACDGKIGLTLAEQERFDIVITDLAMPEVDGLTVLRQLKKRQPETAVLVITGDSTADPLAASVNLGVDGYVNKPFEMGDLDKQISRILAQRACPQPDVSLRRTLQAPVPLLWALLAAATLVLVSHLVIR